MAGSALNTKTVVLAPVPGPAPGSGPTPTPRVRPGPGDDPTVVQRLPSAAGRHRRGGASGTREPAIFLDRSGRRKRRLTWVLALAAMGGLIYTVALVGTMLGGVDADSALPRPGEKTTAPATKSPSAAPRRSASTSARAVRGPTREVQASATRSARPKPSSPQPTHSVPSLPEPVPTTEDPGSFWSSLLPSPRD